MATIGLEIDPTEEDANNVPLNLNDGTIFRATETAFPTPGRDVNYASSASTEGGVPANLRYENRTITITCWIFGTSAAAFQTQLGYLEQKIGKINDEGATLQYTSTAGTPVIFDLLEGSADPVTDVLAAVANRTQVTLTFTAKPFWRAGVEHPEELGFISETTLPCAIVTHAAPGGDVPALGFLNVTESQGKDQWTLLWATQARNYSSSVNAELFYEAESRTPKAGEKKAGPTGASGSGENTIFCGTLIPAFQPIMSTQKASAGAHLSHVGSYRVFARVQRPATNTGSVSIALEWQSGAYLRPSLNESKTWEANELEDQWTIVDLGLVHLDKARAGLTQQWEGRILAKSTANGDDIYVDYLMLFPVDEDYGELKTVPSASTATSLSAHDEFDQTSGALDTPKALPLGGNWSLVEKTGAEGWKVNEGNHNAERAKTGDANLFAGSFALAGTTERTAMQVQADFTVSTIVLASESWRLGVIGRYVSTNSWLMAFLTYRVSAGPPGKVPVPGIYLEVWKRVGGSPLYLCPPVLVKGGLGGASKLGATTVKLSANALGAWQAWAFPAGLETPAPIAFGRDKDLETGETLATGKNGIFDVWTSGSGSTRTADNFAVYTGLLPEAAVAASAQTQIFSDKAVSAETGGTTFYPRHDYRGSYFKVPPARREARTMRTIVKLSRGNIDTMADPAIDDLYIEIIAWPRGLVLPDY